MGESDRPSALTAVNVAGYRRQTGFLESNRGLESRFKTSVQIDNFTTEQLVEIFQRLCAANDYVLAEDAAPKIAQIFDQRKREQGNRFANGRFARNLFEQTLRNHSLLLCGQEGHLDREALTTLRPRILFSRTNVLYLNFRHRFEVAYWRASLLLLQTTLQACKVVCAEAPLGVPTAFSSLPAPLPALCRCCGSLPAERSH